MNLLKTLLLVCVFISSGSFAKGTALNDYETVKQIFYDKWMPVIEATRGYTDPVTGVYNVNNGAVVVCDPATGELSLTADPFVYCFSLNATSHKIYDALLTVFPTGTKFEGVFVDVAVNPKAP